MWQIFALLSSLSTALQSVTDKWTMLHARRIDATVATFWRVALLFMFTTVVGIFEWLGPLRWYFDGWILLFGFTMFVSGYCYTYLLRRIEITSIQAEMYLMPLIFLGVDALFLHAPLSVAQIIGVVLLAVGGFLLAVDGKTHRLKREFSFIVWLVLLYWIFYNGFQFYIFKYQHVHAGLNSVSFFASGLLVTTILLMLAIGLGGKATLLFRRDSARYIPGIAVSKIFDTTASLLYFVALSSAAVSQVSAFGAIEPLLLLIIAFIAQRATSFSIRERLDRANMHWKILAIALLCAGTFLVS